MVAVALPGSVVIVANYRRKPGRCHYKWEVGFVNSVSAALDFMGNIHHHVYDVSLPRTNKHGEAIYISIRVSHYADGGHNRQPIIPIKLCREVTESEKRSFNLLDLRASDEVQEALSFFAV